jgi:L,D-transpeptidase YcbB
MLVTLIGGLGAEGLVPADYQPEALKAAIAAGAGDRLDELASRMFSWVIEDLRDGRAPMSARVQWFAVDPDREAMPTAQVMAQALSEHDVVGVVAKLQPVHPDFAKLKAKLAAVKKGDAAARGLILANMDRWRWLPRDLGKFYLYSNVPEFQVRLTIRKSGGTYWNWASKTVVGKPGRTATPQLSEMVTAVVFNPTWTVPQSISVGEGLGQKVLNNPNWARNNGYKAVKGSDGTTWVVQQPGPDNALGLMKIDMPNEHAIYFHDTPAKSYFDEDVRAFSHGCVRTQEAVELGMLLGILGAGKTRDEVLAIHKSGEYTKVELTKPFPVYITYFTYASQIDPETSQFGPLTKFGDIYGRDKPVIDSFARPRELKTTQRKSDEEVIKLDNPL